MLSPRRPTDRESFPIRISPFVSDGADPGSAQEAAPAGAPAGRCTERPLTPGASSWRDQSRYVSSDAPVPKIGAVLALIALILFGLAVLVVAAVLLLRSARAFEPREARYPGRRSPDPKQGEREVYEKLYGKRSATVSTPSPVEAPPKADADSPRTHTPSADSLPRTHGRSRARDSHR